MVTYSHAIYIDESGNGAPTADIHRFWVSVGVSVAFDRTRTLDDGIRTVVSKHFSPYIKELKGSAVTKYLRIGASVLDVAEDVGNILDDVGAHCWAVASSHGSNPPVNLHLPHPRAKDIARQLLLERINGLLIAGYHHPDHSLIVWDISTQQELQDFSASIANFRNTYDGTPRSDRLAPAALGGLSHDWSGLQTADIIAHCALHYLGLQSSMAGSKVDKARAFKEHFLPRLQKDSKADLVGWKVW